MLKTYSWIISDNFLRLWSGMIASKAAYWLFYYSLIWWSIEETDSAIQGGILLGIGIAVSLTVSPISGWLADRFHRGKILTFSDLATTIGFGVIAGYSFHDSVPLWMMYMVQGFLALAQAPVVPAFRSLLPEVVGNDRLEKAIAFQNTLLETLQVIPPLLMGVLVTFVSFEWLWLSCGLLTLISAFFEWRIRDPRGNRPDVKMNRTAMGAGFRKLFQHRPLRLLAISTGIQQLMFVAFPLYIAVWTTLTLQGNALTGGALQAAWALGFIGASFFLAFFIPDVERLKRWIPILLLFFGIFIGPFGWVSNEWFAAFLLLSAGSISGIVNVYLEGFLQRLSEGKEKGRILSAFSAVHSALIPVGYVIGGILSDWISPTWLFVFLVLPIPFVSWCIRKSFILADQEEVEECLIS